MKYRWLLVCSVIGALIGLGSAIYYNLPKRAQPPAFQPASNPFEKGVYANGIVESDQGNGSNINLFAEVSAPVKQIYVTEGQSVSKDDALIALDDRVQRATAEQLDEQSNAAKAQLDALHAMPRAEVLRVAKAQADVAMANIKLARDQYEKLKRAFDLEAGAVSREALDNAANTLRVSEANGELANRQLEQTRAGAWRFDVNSQESQYKALKKSAEAAWVTLDKYVVRAPADGVILAINATVGSYVSPQGAYTPYTQSNAPVIVLSSPQKTMNVRVYLDEILASNLPSGESLRSEMVIRGTNLRIPLRFIRVQPYVTPKIQLSNQRQERVDVRVLPLIFRFENPEKTRLYPGQLVDVFIATKDATP